MEEMDLHWLAQELASRLRARFAGRVTTVDAIVDSVTLDATGRAIRATAIIEGIPRVPIEIPYGHDLREGARVRVMNVGSVTAPRWALTGALGGVESGAAASGPAGGDLSGRYPNPTVAGIQGKPVTAASPSQGQILRWDASEAKWMLYLLRSLADQVDAFPTQEEGRLIFYTPGNTLFLFENGAWRPIANFGALQLYVDGAQGTDAPGYGFSPGSGAVRTIQYAVQLIPPILGGFVHVSIAAGTYTEEVDIRPRAFLGPYRITLEGVITYVASGTITAFQQTARATGVGVVKTSGLSTVVTTTGSFSGLWPGAILEANGEGRMVVSIESSTSCTVDRAVDWDNGGAGFSWRYSQFLIEDSNASWSEDQWNDYLIDLGPYSNENRLWIRKTYGSPKRLQLAGYSPYSLSVGAPYRIGRLDTIVVSPSTTVLQTIRIQCDSVTLRYLGVVPYYNLAVRAWGKDVLLHCCQISPPSASPYYYSGLAAEAQSEVTVQSCHIASMRYVAVQTSGRLHLWYTLLRQGASGLGLAFGTWGELRLAGAWLESSSSNPSILVDRIILLLVYWTFFYQPAGAGAAIRAADGPPTFIYLRGQEIPAGWTKFREFASRWILVSPADASIGYPTLSEALRSITDASSSNPYTVVVTGRVVEQTTVVAKSHVHVYFSPGAELVIQSDGAVPGVRFQDVLARWWGRGRIVRLGNVSAGTPAVLVDGSSEVTLELEVENGVSGVGPADGVLVRGSSLCRFLGRAQGAPLSGSSGLSVEAQGRAEVRGEVEAGHGSGTAGLRVAGSGWARLQGLARGGRAADSRAVLIVENGSAEIQGVATTFTPLSAAWSYVSADDGRFRPSSADPYQLVTLDVLVVSAQPGVTVRIGTSVGGSEVASGIDLSSTGVRSFPLASTAYQVISAGGYLYATPSATIPDGAFQIRYTWAPCHTGCEAIRLEGHGMVHVMGAKAISNAASDAIFLSQEAVQANWLLIASSTIERRRGGTTAVAIRAEATYGNAPVFLNLLVGGALNITPSSGTGLGTNIVV